MQLLRNVNVNWVGHKWLFIGISLVMTIVSLSSLYWKGGPRYGIDFRGGTLVYVKFKSSPNLTAIRTALSQKGLGNSTIQRYDLPEQNQVIISLDQLEDDSKGELDAGRGQILQALKTVFNSKVETSIHLRVISCSLIFFIKNISYIKKNIIFIP